MHLKGAWTDGRTDGQGDSYIPPQTLFAGGIKISEHFQNPRPNFRGLGPVIFNKKVSRI